MAGRAIIIRAALQSNAKKILCPEVNKCSGSASSGNPPPNVRPWLIDEGIHRVQHDIQRKI